MSSLVKKFGAPRRQLISPPPRRGRRGALPVSFGAVLPFSQTDREIGSIRLMIGLRQLINSVVQRLREQEASESQPAAQDVATPRQGLPRLLSDEDERASQPEGGDMWNVMHDEDGRRERLFRLENASACFRQPTRRPTPGAHVGYQMAQRATARVYCCAGCGALTPCSTAPP